MSFTRLSRPAAAGVGSLIVACAAAGVFTAPAAHADAVGTLTVTPHTGLDSSGISLQTSALCPDPATNLIVTVKGSGFPAAGQNVVSNSPLATYNAAGSGFTVPLTQTMRDYANTAGFTTLQGRYDFTLTCRTAFNPTSLGDFTGAIWFTSDTTFQDTDPNGPTTPPTTTGTPTGTPTSTPTDTGTPTGTPTDTGTPTGTPSDTPIDTPTDTATPSDTPTDTPTDTASPTGAPTGTSAAGGGSGTPGTSGTSGGSGSGSGGSQDVSTTVSGGSNGGGSLAATGTNAATLGSVAAVLVLAGGAAVLQTRRRRTAADSTTSND